MTEITQNTIQNNNSVNIDLSEILNKQNPKRLDTASLLEKNCQTEFLKNSNLSSPIGIKIFNNNINQSSLVLSI